MGCGAELSACESAMSAAADIPATEDTVTDLDQAIECASVADFEAAAEQIPDALDGVDAHTFLSNRCASEPAIDSPICDEVFTPAAS
jgi:hypothetical protein